MKKIIPAISGSIIAAILLFTLTANPNTYDKIYSGESPIRASEVNEIAPEGYVRAKVKKIVDGDTLYVLFKGNDYKVRLLCIDTPETVMKGVDEQPYGKLATEKLSLLVLNKEVTLIFEKDIDDKYGRLLAYVMLDDGTCVNTALVEQGLARIQLVEPNTIYEEYFNELQNKAIVGKKGLWSLPEKERPFILNEDGYYIPRYIDKAAASDRK